MAEKLVMLALSPTMEVGTIGRWLVAEGGAVRSGEVLCEVQTDKATMEYESLADGTLLAILVPEGGQARVGEPIAIVGQPGEDLAGLLSEPAPPAAAAGEQRVGAGQAAAQATTAPMPPAASGAPPAPAPSATKIKASPLARALAREEGLDLALVRGSGPGGRIVERDVRAAQEARGRQMPAAAPALPLAAPAAGQTVPVSEKRRVIAQRLADSMFSAPHYYLRVSVAMDKLLASRAALNEKRQEKVSVNAFLLKLSAEALRRHPQVNATWNGDTITYHGAVDVALAVAQRDGLIAPVVRNCAAKGIVAIDEELRVLIEKAQKGTLTPPEYQGATFTISNLGSFGIEEFTAIINPPGSAILAVGAIRRVQLFGPGDVASIASVAALTLSCDHRVIDGAVGAAFLADLKAIIEDPMLALY